jgi:hypothetical protein
MNTCLLRNERHHSGGSGCGRSIGKAAARRACFLESAETAMPTTSVATGATNSELPPVPSDVRQCDRRLPFPASCDRGAGRANGGRLPDRAMRDTKAAFDSPTMGACGLAPCRCGNDHRKSRRRSPGVRPALEAELPQSDWRNRPLSPILASNTSVGRVSVDREVNFSGNRVRSFCVEVP